MIAKVYVGLSQAHSKDILVSRTEQAEKWALEFFGGYTRYTAKDGWRDGGKDYKEDCHVWEFVTEDKYKVNRFATFVRDAFLQVSVLVVFQESSEEFIGGAP